MCKHCGRDLDAAPAAPRTTAARRTLAVRRPFVLAVVGAVVCGAAVAGAASGRVLAERPAAADTGAPGDATNQAPNAAAAADGTAAVAHRRAPPPPEVLALVDAEAVEIGPEHWLHFGFTVAHEAPACRLRGRALALTGGNKDVEVYVLSADDYLNWRNGGVPPYTAAFSGPRQTATTLDVELPAGEYHLVISNRFSVATAKTVQARARVVCAGAGSDAGGDA